MAKGIYVGVESKARKVKKFYIGVDGKARKVKKGYVGVNGVARLFYSAETLVPFTTCPYSDVINEMPTNEYGTWKISAWSKYSDDYQAYKAFDEDTSTYWRSAELLSSSASSYVQLFFPTGVLIKPATVKVVCRKFVRCFIEGYNPETGAWERIGEATSSGSSFTTTNLTYSGDVYFSGIRAYGARYSSSVNTPEVADLKITSGTIKLEG